MDRNAPEYPPKAPVRNRQNILFKTRRSSTRFNIIVGNKGWITNYSGNPSNLQIRVPSASSRKNNGTAMGRAQISPLWESTLASM
jgi:hypothetical protein